MLRTANFSYEPIPRSEAPKRGGGEEFVVWLREPFSHGNAGNVFFHDPGYRWESMSQDQIVRTHPVEWALARLLFMLRESDPLADLEPLMEFQGDSMRLPFLARDQINRLVCQLALTSTKNEVTWQGPAVRYLPAKNASEELEALMFAQPERLAPYQFAVPWRKAMGWNQKRFLGQRTVRRPDFFLTARIAERQLAKAQICAQIDSNVTAVRKFSVTEYSPVEQPQRTVRASKKLRYTDAWPPLEIWEDIPNWKHAYNEEGRSGQDETTIKPARVQSFISSDVDYTVGEAHLPDGRTFHAVLSVDSGTVGRVAVFEGPCYWEFDCGACQQSALSPPQAARFPMRLYSRLSLSQTDPSQIIRIRVDGLGQVSELLDDG